MPLALEPDAKYEVVLSSDSDKPEDRRPTFVFRYLNSREWKELTRQSGKFVEDDSGEGAIDAVFNVIRMALVGWRNMIGPDGKEIPYDPNELDAIVTPSEAMELMLSAENQIPNVDDKKKFGSQSRSSTGRSARSARDRKNAKKSQQQ